MICYATIFVYPVAIINRILGGLGFLVMPIIYVLLAASVLTDKGVTKYVRFSDVGLVLFFFIYILFSLLIDEPQQTAAISEALVPEFLPCIPFLLFGLCLRIDATAMDTLGKWSCLAIIMTSFYRMYYQDASAEWENDYNMSAAYELLPNILLAINYCFHAKKKIIPIICSTIGFFYLFAMGTRGPIVVSFALLIICIFLYASEKISLKRIIPILIIAGIMIGVIMTNLLTILEWLGGVLSSMGLSTRVIELSLAEEVISNTSGRDDIYDLLLSKMDTLPFFGYGVLGENRFNILTAHNLYIQSIFDYGYVLGGSIIMFLVIISVKAFFKTRGRITQQWIIIWMVFVLVRGFFGGGILRFETFMLIGCCLRVIRMNKIEIQ